MNIALWIVCGILAVLGVVELARLLVLWWSRPFSGKGFSLVVLPENAEECEYMVRAAAERLRWLELKTPCRLICVNLSGDPEINSICRVLSARYPMLRVSKAAELLYHCMEEKGKPQERTE